jgi:hypothetical protein
MSWLKQIDGMAFPSSSIALDAILMITVALRVVVLLLSLWNLWWSFPSARALLRSNQDPITIVVATIFWASATATTFQVAYFVGVSPVWRLAATIVLAISMTLAALSHRISIIANSNKLEAIYDHLEPALAIAELAKVNPDAAKAMADQCRHMIADSLIKRA